MVSQLGPPLFTPGENVVPEPDGCGITDECCGSSELGNGPHSVGQGVL